LSWDNDAMTILFSNAKNDQEGRYQYPRHVYPNPLNPTILDRTGKGLTMDGRGYLQVGMDLIPDKISGDKDKIG
jgi:hypothetical protein